MAYQLSQIVERPEGKENDDFARLCWALGIPSIDALWLDQSEGEAAGEQSHPSHDD